MTTLRVARRSHWCTSKLTTWRVNLTILSLRICPLCSGDVTSLLWVCIDSEFAHLHLFANEHFLPVLYAPLQSVICIYFLYQILGWRFVRSFFVFSTVCHYLPQCIRGPRSLDYWITITWFLGATDAEESSSKNGKGTSQRIESIPARPNPTIHSQADARVQSVTEGIPYFVTTHWEQYLFW